ncbi:hypothetical protein IC617_08685 [Neiella sp. HB171785]|uniref:Uncharacterized protein n=1 Tax=Neiella litorisoli TaxID=2771431 RepID=A0A8J6QJ44_9GAMM|nr:hypothetical protein [Neiella litorisoli]MBD1389502.1 hypothetical protein [Neiella litorisoli]
MQTHSFIQQEIYPRLTSEKLASASPIFTAQGGCVCPMCGQPANYLSAVHQLVCGECGPIDLIDAVTVIEGTQDKAMKLLAGVVDVAIPSELLPAPVKPQITRVNQLCQLLLLENEPMFQSLCYAGWSLGDVANSYLGSTGSNEQLMNYKRRGEYLPEIDFLMQLPRDTLVTALADGKCLNAVLFETIPIAAPVSWSDLPNYHYHKLPTKDSFFNALPVNKHSKWGVVNSHPYVALYLLSRGFACVLQRTGKSAKHRHCLPQDTIAQRLVDSSRMRLMRDTEARTLWDSLSHCPKSPASRDRYLDKQASWISYASHLLGQGVPPSAAMERANERYGICPSWTTLTTTN